MFPNSAERFSFDILIMKRLLKLIKLSYLAEMLGKFSCVKNGRFLYFKKFVVIFICPFNKITQKVQKF